MNILQPQSDLSCPEENEKKASFLNPAPCEVLSGCSASFYSVLWGFLGQICVPVLWNVPSCGHWLPYKHQVIHIGHTSGSKCCGGFFALNCLCFPKDVIPWLTAGLPRGHKLVVGGSRAVQSSSGFLSLSALLRGACDVPRSACEVYHDFCSQIFWWGC